MQTLTAHTVYMHIQELLGITDEKYFSDRMCVKVYSYEILGANSKNTNNYGIGG